MRPFAVGAAATYHRRYGMVDSVVISARDYASDQLISPDTTSREVTRLTNIRPTVIYFQPTRFDDRRTVSIANSHAIRECVERETASPAATRTSSLIVASQLGALTAN